MDGLFSKLIDYVAYAHLWHLLSKTNSDDELNYLMLSLVEVEEQVLSHYGLPFTLEYSEIFQDLGIKDNFNFADINICIGSLERAAKEYFSRTVVTDLELLQRAQRQHIDIDYILPELTLKLYAETYYDFCYYFLFLPNKISPTQFLDELRLIVKLNCSLALDNLVKDEPLVYEKNEDYLKLKEHGMLFIDTFLNNYHSFKNNRLDYLRNGLLF